MDQVTLTVTEDGSAIGSYDVQALGLRDDLLQKVNAQFSELDRMPDAQFAALPLQDRLDWAKLGLKPAATVSPDLGQLDLSAVLADLQSVKRTAAQDAYIDLVDGVYTVHEEVAGDELNAAAVQEGLQTAAAGLAVTPSGAQNATFELTSVDCYETPRHHDCDAPRYARQLLPHRAGGAGGQVDFNKDSGNSCRTANSYRGRF